jgi:hypothetical protein
LELCGSSTSQKPRYGVLKLTLQGVTAKDITTGQRLFDWSQRPETNQKDTTKLRRKVVPRKGLVASLKGGRVVARPTDSDASGKPGCDN